MDRGSNSHDEIIYENGNYRRITNRAGGIEGGMSNGDNFLTLPLNYLRKTFSKIPDI